VIKYVCDLCGAEVFEPEAIGQGVFIGATGHNPIKGKVYTFDSDKTGLTLTISVTDLTKEENQHFCYGCMWLTVKDMVARNSPNELYLNEIAEKVAKIMSQPKGYDEAAKLFDELEREQEIVDVEEVKEVPNEEVSHGTANADNQLPELHAEGVLSETGTDAGPDDPGTHHYPGSRTVSIPNFDPGPTPEAAWAREHRPGWRHPHLS